MFTDPNEMLQEEMKRMINEIDKGYLRKMQGDMHRCAALCCDDRGLSHDNFQICIDRCGADIQAAQELIRNEMGNFQDRLNRCHMACNDQIRDKMSLTPSQAEIEKYRDELNKCGNKCAETHIELISQMFKRINKFLSKTEFSLSNT